MKIAITGGTAGIGAALADIYESLGHEVLRLSRRNGHNIRSIPKTADVIEDCDVFVNNAQAGFAQTELLFEMCARWQNTHKKIVVVSTMMTQDPVSVLPGLDMDLYRVQKVALEEAVRQLRFKRLGIQILLVRPGNIATSPDKTVPPAADVENWARKLVNILESASPELEITEISLGPQ